MADTNSAIYPFLTDLGLCTIKASGPSEDMAWRRCVRPRGNPVLGSSLMEEAQVFQQICVGTFIDQWFPASEGGEYHVLE